MTSFVTDMLSEQRKAREATQRLQLQAEAAWAKEEVKIAGADTREKGQAKSPGPRGNVRSPRECRSRGSYPGTADTVDRAGDAPGEHPRRDPYVSFDQLKETYALDRLPAAEQLAVAAAAPQERDFMPEPLRGWLR